MRVIKIGVMFFMNQFPFLWWRSSPLDEGPFSLFTGVHHTPTKENNRERFRKDEELVPIREPRLTRIADNSGQRLQRANSETFVINLDRQTHEPCSPGRVGRGCGVGRGLGVTPGVAVAVAVGVGVGVAVAVGVTVGVGEAQGSVAINSPNATGPLSPVTVSITVLLEVSMTETVLSPKFAT